MCTSEELLPTAHLRRASMIAERQQQAKPNTACLDTLQVDESYHYVRRASTGDTCSRQVMERVSPTSSAELLGLSVSDDEQLSKSDSEEVLERRKPRHQKRLAN